MISASPDLLNLLNSGNPFVMADLYTISLASGQTLRYTTADIDLTVNGNVFTSSGVYLTRDTLNVVTGIQVDELTLSVYADPNLIIANGMNLPTAITRGVFDKAIVKLERGFAPNWASPVVGTIILYLGWIAAIDFGRSQAKVSVKSILELLNIKMPRNLVQANCGNTLYDGGCGLSRDAWGINYQTAVGSTSQVILVPAMNKATGYYDMGVIQFTSGVNSGLKRTVRTQAGNSITTILPFPNIPAVGDTFNLYAGCDKTKATCQSKFANLGNFRGCPYVPVPEVMM